MNFSTIDVENQSSQKMMLKNFEHLCIAKKMCINPCGWYISFNWLIVIGVATTDTHRLFWDAQWMFFLNKRSNIDPFSNLHLYFQFFINKIPFYIFLLQVSARFSYSWISETLFYSWISVRIQEKKKVFAID